MRITLCYRLGMILLCVVLNGCAGIASLADSLNERDVKSCIWAQGSYGPFVGLRLVSVTGGATLAECHLLQ